MEIFSIGEKIKRTRTYKGYTLKDLCGNKLSVSKLSCIENDKLPPEDWVLEYIASKLYVDIDYLKSDIKTQIKNNITQIENNKECAEYESKLNYNLEFALKYKYYDEAFYIMHLLFLYNLENDRIERLQALIPRYCEISVKSSLPENQLKYYTDFGEYLYKSKEYIQAINYYNIVEKGAERKKKNYIQVIAVLSQCKCYVMLKNYKKVNELSQKLLDRINYLKNDIEKAEVYSILAVLSIVKKDMQRFKIYKYIACMLYGDEIHEKARAKYNFAIAMMNVDLKNKGKEYMKNTLDYYSKDDLSKLTIFKLICLEHLVNVSRDDNIEELEDIINDTIDCSIKTNNMKCIERAYHYKSILSEMKEDQQEQEIYMNLSLDVLIRCGKKKDLYKRYIDLGNMYYNMNSVEESIKYFNLAVKLGEKI